MPNLEQVTTYTVHVQQTHSGLGWSGQFDFKPNAVDVAAAIRMDIVKLEPVQDFDQDDLDRLNNSLDLVNCQSPNLPKHVKVAGMFVGSITVTDSSVFVKEVESMMPPLHPQTTLTREVKNANPTE